VRSVDVQVRLGSPAEDNTHGDHRNSALTTLPLPLTDDREAIARSLWYATNRGYGRALDGFLKVKTEQQVRAKEEDTSADFSVEQPQVDLLPPAPALVVDRAAWEQRLREISKLFAQFPTYSPTRSSSRRRMRPTTSSRRRARAWTIPARQHDW